MSERTLVVAITAMVITIMICTFAANIMWQPYEGQIRMAQLGVEITCIENGGVYDDRGICLYSK